MKIENIGGIDLKRDLQQVTTLIQEYVDTTYLSQIHKQINTYRKQCEEAPCKEAQLLRAVVPFIEDENKERFSNLIEMMTYSQMIQAMLPHYSSKGLFARGEEESESDDYMHQAILALFLYKAIRWAEEYKES